MSSDSPHSFEEPSAISPDSSNRDALAKPLVQILDADSVKGRDGGLDRERANAAMSLYDQRRRRA